MNESLREYFSLRTLSLGLRESRFTLHEGRVVLITALPYGEGTSAAPCRETPVGSVAAFAQRNFYRELVSRLKKLLKEAERDIGLKAKECRIFCNSRFPEKKFAALSGLGSPGKNSLLYIPEGGSFFVLGGILLPRGMGTSLSAPLHRASPPGPTGEICGACEACMRACPVGAIHTPGEIDRTRCIQSFTAVPVMVPPDIRDRWGIVLYGCDVCQKVCPLNRGSPPAADTNYGILGPTVPLERILDTPDSELRKELFRGTVLDQGWISETAIKRNALMGAAHQKAEGLTSLLRRYTRHPHAVLRETAAWAIRFLES